MNVTIERKKSDCSALPKGWQREEVLRKTGLSAGKVDVYYYRLIFLINYNHIVLWGFSFHQANIIRYIHSIAFVSLHFFLCFSLWLKKYMKKKKLN